MSKETDVTLAIKSAETVEILRNIQDGMTEEEACSQAGITVRTLHNRLARSSDGIRALQEIQAEDARNRYRASLIARTTILDKVIEDGMNPLTKPGERLAILRELDKIADKASEEARLNADTSSLADEVLTGPKLRQGVSRMTVVHGNVTIYNSATASQDDVVDADFRDAQPPLLESG